MKTLGEVKRTARGFEWIEFTDHYGVKCSLQASSLVVYEPGTSAVWLGCDSADGDRRMHLDRGQVKTLIRHLQSWLKRDTFKVKP